MKSKRGTLLLFPWTRSSTFDENSILSVFVINRVPFLFLKINKNKGEASGWSNISKGVYAVDVVDVDDVLMMKRDECNVCDKNRIV